jgi:hypothetical protein
MLLVTQGHRLFHFQVPVTGFVHEESGLGLSLSDCGTGQHSHRVGVGFLDVIVDGVGVASDFSVGQDNPVAGGRGLLDFRRQRGNGEQQNVALANGKAGGKLFHEKISRVKVETKKCPDYNNLIPEKRDRI